MNHSIEHSTDRAPRVIPEMRPVMVKATVRKREVEPVDIGFCLDVARRKVGWNLDELAHALGKDARQVRRWISGDERTQMDVVFSVEQLRAPFVVALAELSGLDVVTTIAVRRPWAGEERRTA